jgi:choline dehydrogenase
MHDYVIVGAGSAGSVLANRLTEDPCTTVLLLEAGPSDRNLYIHIPAATVKLFKTDRDWNYATEPQEQAAGRALYWPRGKMLGGSSSMNHSMYVRGHRADYDAWAARGNPGWAYEDVLPYFKKGERNQRGPSADHGHEGPLWVSDLRSVNPLTRAFLAAGAAAGLPQNPDIGGAEPEGLGLTQVTQKKGRRCSAAVAYLQPARGRPNLKVLTRAQATRVVLEGRRAVGVSYRRNGTEHTARAAREVVLSAGTVNSPQLLMLSGIGPARHLQQHGIPVAHDLPGVGENLQDHLMVPVIYRCREPVTMSNVETFGNLLRWLILRRGPYTSSGAEACAFVRTRPELPAPDLELILVTCIYRNHYLQPPPRAEHGFSIVVVLLQPKSAGRIRLRSADPFAPPRIHANYLTDPDELRVAVEGIALARRIVAAAPLDRYRGDELDPGAGCQDAPALEAYVRGHCESLYHPVGTCTMGCDPLAVVDETLRVQGIEGLRVVDASIMPVIIRGHTNAPTVMIAEKAADMIRTRALSSVVFRERLRP